MSILVIIWLLYASNVYLGSKCSAINNVTRIRKTHAGDFPILCNKRIPCEEKNLESGKIRGDVLQRHLSASPGIVNFVSGARLPGRILKIEVGA